MDTTKLGEVTAALMELIDAENPDAELGEVMVLAEIQGTDEEGGWTGIRWRCSDSRYWVQDGLLYAALNCDRETG